MNRDLERNYYCLKVSWKRMNMLSGDVPFGGG